MPTLFPYTTLFRSPGRWPPGSECAHAEPQGAPGANALLLYDRWLPGMLRRCHDVMKTCGPAGCANDRNLRYQALYQDIAAAHAPAPAPPCNPRADTTPDPAATTGPASSKPGTRAWRR